MQRLKAFKAQQEREETTPKSNPFGNDGGLDQRDYGVGAQILRDLGISKIQLITRSQKRRVGLVGYGLEIVEIISL